MKNPLRLAFTVIFTIMLGVVGLVAAYDQLGGGAVQRALAEHGLQGRLPLLLLALALVLLAIAFAFNHWWEWYAWCRRAEYAGRADELTAQAVDRGRKLARHEGLAYTPLPRLLQPSAYATGAAADAEDRLRAVFAEAEDRHRAVFAEAEARGAVRGLIVEGPSLAGKTRLLVEWLRVERSDTFVVAPRAGEPLTPHPRLRRFRQQGVCLLLDDLERYGPRVQEIVGLLARLDEWKVPSAVLATVADGAPLSTVATAPEFHPLRRTLLQLRVAPLSPEAMAAVAAALDRPLAGDPLEHEPTFAWLLREEFRDAAARHAALPVRGRLALSAARALDERGVPAGGDRWRRAAEDLFDFPREAVAWTETLEALRHAGFVAGEAPEPVYLRHVVARALPPEQEDRALRDGFVARGDHGALVAWGWREGFERGDHAAAVSLLREALALPTPRPVSADAAAQLALGRVLLLQGAADEARAALERAWEAGLRQGVPEGTETAMLAGAELAGLLETQGRAEAGDSAAESVDAGAEEALAEDDSARRAREIRERVVALAGPEVGPHANAAAARCALELGRRALGASLLLADPERMLPTLIKNTGGALLEFLGQPVRPPKNTACRIEFAEARNRGLSRFEQALALSALSGHADPLVPAQAAGEMATVQLHEAGLSLARLRLDPVVARAGGKMFPRPALPEPAKLALPEPADAATRERLRESAEQMLRTATELAPRAGTQAGCLTAAWCALVLGLLFREYASEEHGKNIGRHAVFCADAAAWLRQAVTLADQAGGTAGLELAADAACYLGVQEQDWRRDEAQPAFSAAFEYGMRAGSPAGRVSACRACVHMAALEGAPNPPSYYSHAAAALGIGTRTVDFYRAALEVGIESGVIDAVPFLAEAAIQYLYTAAVTREPVELTMHVPEILFHVERTDDDENTAPDQPLPQQQLVPEIKRRYTVELDADDGLVMGETITYTGNLPDVEKPHVRFPGNWQRGTPAAGGAATHIQLGDLTLSVPAAGSR